MMAEKNEKANPFLPQSTKSDSSSIFSYRVIKPSFGKTSENVPVEEAPSKLDTNLPSESSDDCKVESVPSTLFGISKSAASTTTPPIRSSTSNIFRGKKQTESVSGASDDHENEMAPSALFGTTKSAESTTALSIKPTTSNIFGGKIQTDPIPDTAWRSSSPFSLCMETKGKQPFHKVRSSSSEGESFSKHKSKEPTFSTQSIPVFAVAQVSVTASQLKQNKDIKSNIFGEVVSTAPETFLSIQKPDSVQSTVTEGNTRTKLVFSKPTLVFSSKLDRKESSKKDIFSVVAKKSSSKSDYSQRSGSSDLNVKSKKEVKDEYADIFGTITESTLPRIEPCTLIAVGIPENYLEKSILHNHFSRFGSVQKVFVHKKTNQASIYFDGHKSAAEAKAKGKILHPLLPEMKLLFAGQVPAIKRKSGHVKRDLDTKEQSLPTHAPPTHPSGTTPSIQPPACKEKSSEQQLPEKQKSFSLVKKSDFRNKAPSGNLGSIKDFSALMNSQAKNNYDKFLILDARDKALRTKQKKVNDVKKARYLLAACPDMCPEKERYSRDIQYDISIYEMKNEEMDHKLVVKKFSRSSADKDEPLPHELRPGSILKMTMDFLICNIIKQGDNPNIQIDLWYNYLCNRTRALRNDIMQQHLLNHYAVYVLERCTRFHIHCSHHLCEESADYFDAKMNLEHLSKSLQSLKELYQDLAEKGLYYNTESEFRAYEILLNVSDSNIIFRYLKFRDEVRTSSEVQFAVEVLHSIHTNNYVQFFKLVTKATYLQACIIHKYFMNVRIKALSLIVKAYPSQQLPVQKVMTMLGFSDESKFKSFIEHFCIDVMADSLVIINKAKFQPKPDPLPSISKSADVILVKKDCSIGEVIHNGPLPENPLATYKPHSSFNSKGYLNENAKVASDQTSVVKYKDQESEKKIKIDRHMALKTQKLEDEVNNKITLFVETKLLHRYFGVWKIFVEISLDEKHMKEEAKLLRVKKIVGIWKEKAAKSTELNRKVEAYLKSKYLQKWKTYTSVVKENRAYLQCAKVIEEKVLMKKFTRIWRHNALLKVSIREAEKAQKYLLARKYLKRWHLHTQLSKAETKSIFHYETKLMRFSFKLWKDWCSMFGTKNKLDLKSFHAIGSDLSPHDQDKLLDWGYNRHDRLNMSADQILELDKVIYARSRKHYYIQQLSDIIAWTPLPIIQRFQADVNASPDFSQNCLTKCFKVLLLTDSEADSYLLEWVRVKFNILEMDDLQSPLRCQSKFRSCHDERTFFIIVSEKKIASEHSVDFDGASIVILVGKTNNLIKLSEAVNLKGIPHIAMCRSQSEDISGWNWQLTKETVDNPLTTEKLFNFVFRVWKQDMSSLKKRKLREIVTEFISKEVLVPVYQILTQRKLYKKLMPSPALIVELYNAAISHALKCFVKSRVLACEWPPSEALSLTTGHSKLWNKKDADLVASAMSKAHLPSFSVRPSSSWPAVEEGLTNYVKDVVSLDNWGGNLYSEIHNILKKSQREAFKDDSSEDLGILYQNIPWVDILNACMFFKLSALPDTDVGYMPSDMYAFSCNKKWLTELKNSSIVYVKRNEVETSKRKIPFDLQFQPKKVRKETKSRLLLEIEKEKENSLRFEEELKSVLEAEEELKMLYESFHSFDS